MHLQILRGGAAPGGNPSPRVQALSSGVPCQGRQRLFGGRAPVPPPGQQELQDQQCLWAHRPGQETPAGAGGARRAPDSADPKNPSGPAPAACSGVAALALCQPCPLPGQVTGTR